MKKFFGWVLRLLCLVVIGLAIFTAVRAIMHMHDDHSEQAVVSAQQAQAPEPTFAPQEPVQSTAEPMPSPEVSEEPKVEEKPTMELTADPAGPEDETVTVTATFGNIVNSVQANLTWYLNGEVAATVEDRLLVDGTTETFAAPVAPADPELEQNTVILEVSYDGKALTRELPIVAAAPADEEVGPVTIQTEEIGVTCIEDCSVYKDGNLDEYAQRDMQAEDIALLLDFNTNTDGLKTLKLQFPDGETGWIAASHVTVTEEDCTTDQDYSDEQKEAFVNSMNYQSDTDYLIWVSLYTQKVNVFKGEAGKWELEKSFDCATGVNETPTTTGVFATTVPVGSWDLGDTYVSPVIVFNGGIAFTSQPYDSQTDEVSDDTIGKPASGGSVRLEKDNIQWVVDNVPALSTVVVY